MQNPLIFPLVAVAAGVVVARFVPFTPGEALAPAVVLALLSGCAWRYEGRSASLAALFSAFVFAGTWTAAFHHPGSAPQLNAESGETILLAGCVVEPPAIAGEREQVLVELAPGARARLSLKGNPAPLRYGQQIEVPARMRYPRNFRNPGAFDYVGYLARRDIYWTASASADELKVIPGECGSPFRAAIFALRTAAVERLAVLYAGDEYKTGIMQALLIGDATRVEKIWTEDFRRTGTYHALVISGLHISVLAGTLLFLMRICFVRPAVALPLTGALAWLYAIVSGGEAPVMRSAAGFTLFLIAKWFHRRGRILNLLAAVALLFLALDPAQMFEASFQLSFLSVAAIGAFAAPLMERTSSVVVRASRALADGGRDVHFDRVAGAVRVELRLLAETLSLAGRVPLPWAARAVTAAVRIGAFVFDSMALSLCVQIGLALPMIVYFHRLSISGLTANVIIVPLLNTAVQVGFLAIFTGSKAVAWVAGVLLTTARTMLDWHAAWEPNWRIPDPPLWLGCAFIAALLAVAFAPRFRRAFAAASLALLAASCVYTRGNGAPRTLELTAIDVGQGDALLVRFPDGRTMLVDGGGIPVFGKGRKPRLDIGEDVVSPYLWWRGIRSVDVAVSTHGHDDHCGGLPALVRNFHPREIWMGASRVPTLEGAPVHRMTAGKPFQYGGATVQVLAPAWDYNAEEKPKNNDSLVLLIAYGAHKFLLTGDAERQVEWGLLDAHRVGAVDVLKVAHHGSRSSSTPEFLDILQPRFSLISVGADNLYGLPNEQVLNGLAERHSTVLRTDTLGLVTVTSDGHRLSFSAAQWNGGTAETLAPF